jgi:type III pantothenate kinase
MLTVDLGNTRLKACRWARSAEGFACTDSWSGPHGSLAEFELWLGSSASAPAALASVAERAPTARVKTLLAASGARLFTHPDAGLENRCRQPERVGADRLYAAAGAAELLGRSTLVVDAGTALTVDALRMEGGARVFLGGAIAPGPSLLAQALHAGTARLPLVEPAPGVRALGETTEEALQAGVVVGFRGAATMLLEEIAREAELDSAAVVLTGGAREFLLVPRPFTTRRLEVVPDLVHRGLLAALLRAEDALRR